MCEYCKECGIVSVEEYEADDDELCEFLEEPTDSDDFDMEPPMCPGKGRYLVSETTVEDHLCAQHFAKVQKEEADADLFVESIGLDSSTVLPIEEDYSGPCEYFDPLDPKAEACTQRATYARVLEFETLFCEEHLRQYQDEMKRQAIETT